MVLQEASEAHRALYENGNGFNDYEQYLPDDPDSVDLLSKAEIDALIKQNQNPGWLECKDALADIDLLFRAYRSAYGAYYYFGDDAFSEARNRIVERINEFGNTISTEPLRQILYEELEFMRDAHAYSSLGGDEKAIRYEYFFCDKQVFTKDEQGYYKYIGESKWYFDGFSDDRFRMERSLTDDGSIVYTPILFCTKEEMTSGTIQLKSIDGETMQQPIEWTENTAYAEAVPFKRSVDYQLLRSEGLVYLSMRSCDLAFKDELNQFVQDAKKVKDAKVIVFDLRSNSGGADEFPRDWVKNFSGTKPQLPQIFSRRASPLANKYNKETGYGTSCPSNSFGKFLYNINRGKFIRNDIPIIILMDDLCGSSGESALNYLKSLENAIVVGSNSSGFQICGNVMDFWLPESGLCFTFGSSLSFTFSMDNVDYKSYEPDIWCDPQIALETVLNMLEKGGVSPESAVEQLRTSLAQANAAA